MSESFADSVPKGYVFCIPFKFQPTWKQATRQEIEIMRDIVYMTKGRYTIRAHSCREIMCVADAELFVCNDVSLPVIPIRQDVCI